MSFRNDIMMMNDPVSQNSRIFIGNIPVPGVTKMDLDNHFRKYGTIKGIAVNPRGFGFIQYEEEESALSAIKYENGVMFFGKKIDVNLARTGAKPQDNGRDRSPLGDRNRLDDKGRPDDRGRFDDRGRPDGGLEGRPDERPPLDDRARLDSIGRADDRGRLDDRMRFDDRNMMDNRPRLDDRNMMDSRARLDGRGAGPLDRPRLDDRGPGPLDRSRLDDRGSGPLPRLDDRGSGPLDRPPRLDERGPGSLDRSRIDERGPAPVLDRARLDDRGPPSLMDRTRLDDRGPPSLMDRTRLDDRGALDGRPRPLLDDRSRFGPDDRARFGPDDRARLGPEDRAHLGPNDRARLDPGREGSWRDRFDNFPPRRDPLEHERGPGFLHKDAPYPAKDKFGGPGAVGAYAPVGGHATPPVVANMDRTNDCEIIVVNKEQREYAEFIERKLKQIGLTVDLLFPNKEVPIGRVLANISSRGSLYAIVVMPQNEEHRSLTLNILHGQPQEHRNMPLEDAVRMILRDFESYMRDKPSGAGPAPVPIVPAGVSAAGMPERHPESIQTLLNMLADNRPLTTLQYDRIIKYLSDRRDEQMKREVGEDALASDPSIKKQADLQHRILNILNSRNPGGGQSAPAPVAPVPAPVAPPAGGSANWSNNPGSTPLLNDPTVQKALDSLMQGNVLRQISTTQASQSSALGTPPLQPLFGAYSGSNVRRF